MEVLVKASHHRSRESLRVRYRSSFVNCSSSQPYRADEGAALRFTGFAAVDMVAQPRERPTKLFWIAMFDELDDRALQASEIFFHTRGTILNGTRSLERRYWPSESAFAQRPHTRCRASANLVEIYPATLVIESALLNSSLTLPWSFHVHPFHGCR